MKRILLILSAGKQTRFKADFPKALLHVNGVTNIENTLNKVKDLFDEINILINEDDRSYYPSSISDMLVSVRSGFGDGDSLLSYFENRSFSVANHYYILWGDTIILNSKLFEALINHPNEYNADVIVPLLWEENPYVSFDVFIDNNIIHNIEFSKKQNGVRRPFGLHDQSIFKVVNITGVIKELLMLKFTSKEELNFLSLYKNLHFCGHEFYNRGWKTIPYNSLVDVENIGNIS